MVCYNAARGWFAVVVIFSVPLVSVLQSGIGLDSNSHIVVLLC